MHVTPPKPEQRTAAFAEGAHAEPAPTPVALDFLAPSQRPDELGRLGTYRILKILGKGGMGMVFLAEDTKLERQVALKVMLPKFAEDASARQRFLREAKTAAQIEHDHIVHIYQVDEDRGVPFLAMQLLSGSSLEDVLRRAGKLTVSQVLRLGAQIADGLAVAHAKDLIHRDIKPANIWVEANYGGRVKLLDFGLARTVQTDVGITQSGVVVGTPAYMPPEQARGDKVDHRCDLYALGCVMYRMATGELPFKGKDTMALLMALALNEPTPPKLVNEATPDGLNDLILQLLAKDASKRPESAKSVTAALRKIEQGLAKTSQLGDVSDELAALAMPAAAAPAATAPEMTNPVAKLSELPTGALAPTIADSGRTNINDASPTQIAPASRRRKKAAVAGAFALVALIAALLIWRSRDEADALHGSEGKYALYFGGHGDTVAFTGLPQATPKTITIEARVKITGKGHGYIAGMGGDTGYSLWRGMRQFGFAVFQSGNYIGIEFPMEISDRFVHLAGVWDGTEPVLFIDGQRVLGKVERGKWTGALAEDLTTPGNSGQMAIGAFNERLFRLEAVVSGLRISNGQRYHQDFMPPVRFEADDNTFALYRFDEGQGDKLIDSSGNGYHGKIVGAKWMSSTEAAPSRPEPNLPPTAIKSSYALRFAGKTHVQLPPKVINEKLATIPEFTIEAVVTPESEQPKKDGVDFFSSSFQCGMNFRPETGWSSWINQQGTSGSAPWRKGQRAHFALVRRPKDLRFYVNGQLNGWAPLLGQQLPAGKGWVQLGGWRAEDFHGLIEAFRISTVARYDKDFTLPERFVPDANTLVLYRFDEGEGSKLLDSSGNGHHGRIVGAKWMSLDMGPTPRPEPALPPTALKSKHALLLEGKSYVQLPKNIINEKLASGAEFTIEAVVTPVTEQPQKEIELLVSNHQGGFYFTPELGWQFSLNNRGTAGSGPWKKGLRMHLAAVRQAKELRLYINGQLNDWCELSENDIIKGSGGVHVASSNAPSFRGRIEALRMSTVARYHKRSNLPERFVPDKDTIVLYHFDEGQGDKLIDSSGNGHHGKIVGAKWVKVEPPPDAERTFALWALGADIALGIDSALGHTGIESPDELPVVPFRISGFYPKRDKFGDGGMAKLSEAKHLIRLGVGSKTLTDAGVRALLDHSNLENFQMISFSGSSQVSDASIAAVLPRATKLTILNLARTRVTEEGLRDIGRLKVLEELDLRTCKITVQTLHRLASTLTKLRLEGCKTLDDAALAPLGKLLQLRELNLTGTAVTLNGVRQLAAALPKCRIKSDHGAFGPPP